MLAMAGPMILLFEGAIQVARVLDKRRAKRDALAGFHDLDDDEASPLDASPSRLDDQPALEPPSSVADPEPTRDPLGEERHSGGGPDR